MWSSIGEGYWRRRSFTIHKLAPSPFTRLHWLSEGHVCGEIAIILGISVRTVEEQLHTIYHALDAEGALPAVTTIHRAIEDAYLAVIEAFATPLPRHRSRRRRK